MRFAELAATSSEVAATRSRRAKVTAIADTVGRLAPDEVAVGVSYLAGTVRQPRLDLGAAAVHEAGTPAADEPSLTVLDVHEALDAIAAVPTGPGSRTRRVDQLRSLLGRATPAEQDLLTGLVLGELRQGALEGVVVQAISSAAVVPEDAVRRAVMLLGDLGTVARLALVEGEAAVRAARLQLFRPIQPMLAQTVGGVDEAFAGAPPVRRLVDHKYDGARVQVHRSGGEVRVYTRNLRDVTDGSPEVVALVRSLDVDRVVLDGEVLALREDGRPHRFQDTMARFGDDEADADVPLRAFFFDVLHLDGDDLLDEPLAVRLETLRRAVPAEHRVPAAVVSSPAQAREVFRRAVTAGHEGVMIKDLDAPYEAGRRGGAWRKLKPVHSLDLVVLAVEWGSGRRRGWLSNLHLGARDPATGGFVMLGKTFKGLTDEVLEWQTRRFLELETRREGHVVHVRPEQVVEIALDGVQTSQRYPGGVALRFARVKRYRDDKPAEQADTIATVHRIHRGELLPEV